MNKIKDIIVIYPSFEKGGATVNLINFINQCVKKKINTHLISNISRAKKKNFFLKNVILVSNKKFRNIYSNIFLTSIISIFFLISLFKKIRSKNSIVISFQSHLLPIIFCRLFNRKIIIRNSEDILDATKYADNKISAYFIFLLKVFDYNFSNGIITNSVKAKKSLDIITLKHKTKMIYNPYLKKIFNNKNYKRNNVILSVGRLCKQKNQIIAIKAFSVFLKKFPNYKLVLIGHGKDELILKNLCKELKITKKVIFKGWVPKPATYYKSSKILIFPSLYEGLPNTLIEAVNYNLPCISSRCSGAEDILTLKYGTFITKNSYYHLSEKMIDSISNYQKILLKNKIIKKKLNRFLINTQVLKYINYCNNISFNLDK
jgi:GalNAc-alpha-(1->4)-GalNAc-alpha-(1->3)-diNAcBac-PP-undecaprenol alpha-1,4-N-acetyl-D-galactosaminyltransferase